jgi:carboxymethylenebutenolidase
MKREVVVSTSDGPMTGVVHKPESGAPRGIIVFYQDAAGLRPTLYDMAARMSSWGYAVIIPDLYYRVGKLITYREGDPESKPTSPDGTTYPGSVLDLMSSISNERAVAATGDLLAWAETQPDLKGLPVGTVGYCMGGPFVFAAAGAFPDRVRAGGAFYGVGYVTDKDGNWLYVSEGTKALQQYAAKSKLAADANVSKVKGELYFVYAELDPYTTMKEIEPLHKLLEKNGVRHKIDVYEGANHGFAFPEREEYNAAADERHFASLKNLFARNLG